MGWHGPVAIVVTETRGCSQIRFGGPNDEALSGQPLYGRGLDGTALRGRNGCLLVIGQPGATRPDS